MTEQTKTYKHPKLWWVAKPWTFLHNRYSWDIIKNDCFVTWKLETNSIEELLDFWFLPENQVIGEQEGGWIEKAFDYFYKDVKDFDDNERSKILSEFRDAITQFMPQPTEGCNVSPSVDIESIAADIENHVNLYNDTENMKRSDYLDIIRLVLKKHLGTSVSTPPSKVDDFINSKNRIVKAYLDFKKMQKWKQYLENECGAFGRAIYECMPTPPSKVREETI